MRYVLAFLVCFVAACGFPQPKDVAGDGGGTGDSGLEDAGADAAPDALTGPCDLYEQTGCASGEKCTWVVDSDSTGHIDCVPNGSVGPGGACMFDNGTLGHDNCRGGSYCFSGQCRPFCNESVVDACGAEAVCAKYAGVPAGACIPRCNPLEDNAFRQGATKPGTVCSTTQGCYGFPSSDPASPTAFTCAPDSHLTNRVVHRTPCTQANDCAAATPFLNGCSQGYLPVLRENDMSTQVVCIAMCRPQTCYQGNCPAPAGAPPHTCNTTNREGTFDTATTTNNGEHCLFSWYFEVDNTNTLVRSPTSDNVGFCFNHKLFHYDGDADGMADEEIPLCASLSQMDAAGWGCTDSVTAGLPFTGKSLRRRPIDVRLPYGALPIAP